MTKRSGTGFTLLRLALGGSGLVLLALGGRRLARLPDPYPVLKWLGGAVLLHDALVAPLVLAAGLLVAAVPSASRPVVRGALLTAGALVLVALPALLRPGTPANPSVLPLPYGRDLLLLLVLAGIAAVAAVLRARRAARGPRRRARRGR